MTARFDRSLSMFQRFVVGLLLFFAVYRTIVVINRFNGIYPFSPFGWINEQIVITVLYLLFALALARTVPPGAALQRRVDYFFGAFGLGFLGAVLYLRYFLFSHALLSISGFALAVFISFSIEAGGGFVRFGLRMLSSSAFICTALFLGASYLSVGR